MPTQITQTDHQNETRLRVEGEVLYDDAVVIERLAKEILAESGIPVRVDLADIDFMDSEAASILVRMQTNKDLVIDGMEIFLQSAIDTAERTA
ncbi:MAG: hypothetical protein KF685_11865 [Acidobacteria bacterium]|nr:hypothetical protein [Acidobacteriota bacterium]